MKCFIVTLFYCVCSSRLSGLAYNQHAEDEDDDEEILKKVHL